MGRVGVGDGERARHGQRRRGALHGEPDQVEAEGHLVRVRARVGVRVKVRVRVRFRFRGGSG